MAFFNGIAIIFMFFTLIFNKVQEMPYKNDDIEQEQNVTINNTSDEEMLLEQSAGEQSIIIENIDINNTGVVTEKTESSKDNIIENSYPKTYNDDSLSITITKEWFENSWCYVAHVKCDASRFQSIISSKGYGATETCSSVAKRENAILLINGDYYKPNYAPQMYLIRNKQILKDGISDGFGIGFFNDGSLKPIEAGISANDTLNRGIIHSFMFGPVLVSNGNNVAKSEVSAPHTAIGVVKPGEYYVVVSNGRHSDGESKGLNLNQLGELFINKGCTFAYNLDGGGGSEMIFQGEILNSLSDGRERDAMDFIYFK